jgi:thiol-disulfide isomerase/thioredoxin
MFVYLPAREGGYALQYRGTTARTGALPLASGSTKVFALETDGDAVFDATDANPLHLWIDADRDGFFDWDERFDGRSPLALEGKIYEARFSADGTRLALEPSAGPAQVLKERRITRPEQRVLLPAGARAPDFTALRPDGSEMKLSELRGQVVILDFWAPWCGPCKASMPHLDALYKKVKDQGVTVLGLCVWDTKVAFDKWVVKPQVPTSYPLAFDPAGRNSENNNADSIASRLYHVTGIPTFYVIDRDGHVAASYVGSGEASKEGLEAALRKLGVKL